MSKRWGRLALSVTGAVIATAGVVLAYIEYAPRQTPKEQPSLAAIADSDLGPFARAFDAGTASTRILVMLSPT